MNPKRTSEKLVRELTGVRRKRVQSLRNKILAGKYRVSAEHLAKALFLSQ